MGRRTLWIVALVVLGACGERVAGPADVVASPVRAAAIPADAIPGVAGSPTRLDAGAVATDALDPAELETLLADAGFVAGAERSFGQVQGGKKRALARVLVFDREDGARRYLAWLMEHADEVIGQTESLPPPDVPGARFLAVHEPDACCPRETPVYLAAWRSGATVVTLEVGGVGVEQADVKTLASLLDAAI